MRLQYSTTAYILMLTLLITIQRLHSALRLYKNNAKKHKARPETNGIERAILFNLQI
jgi:hypothetical protein